jgi:hypothetical protein
MICVSSPLWGEDQGEGKSQCYLYLRSETVLAVYAVIKLMLSVCCGGTYEAEG